ncbi:MAG: AmmeMemoRadiSam system protein B [Gammaproteobacteria bacterium]|nr:AmmeMemoRadiSam system protein B [Gammaproteobacteria bacterium]
MSKIRPPAVANQFYPANPEQLQQDINTYLQQARAVKLQPKALIVPHAGYIYSGPIAASAYVSLQDMRKRIKKVVLLGPSHHIPFAGLAVSTAHGFLTPLGTVPLDIEAIAKIESMPQVNYLDAAHEQEHSLEVQVPFLQTVLDDFKLIPLVVGDADQQSVAEVLNQLWGDEETLIIISSDLSHYLSYEQAQVIDRRASDAIEALQPELINHDMACGRNPLNGLLELLHTKNLQIKTLDLRNSGDTAGSKDRVVGYGAYAAY